MQATVFDTKSASPQKIFAAGETGFTALQVVYWEFLQAFLVSPQALPPTTVGTKYHCLKVYFQILEWKGCTNEVSPVDWGWKRCDGKLMPVLTNLPPAPDELLKMIWSNCQTDCYSMRCTCRKYNLKCSPACSNCNGSACVNLYTFLIEGKDEGHVENDELYITVLSLSLPISLIITYHCKNAFKLDVIPWFGHYLWNHNS